MTSLTRVSCRIAEVEGKSILNKSGLADYALNCYAGCEHRCVYCYARFATRFSHPGEPWGSFVDVKINAPQLLAKEVRHKKPGTVFISSVCDAWQPAEASYGLTRQCLEILLRCRYPLTILTKSTLAGRDLDLLAGQKEIEFGVTITTLNESLRYFIEPRSSPSAARLELLEEAKRRGVTTSAFLGPLLPYLSDTESNITPLLHAIKEVGVDYFYVDRLNRRFGVWQALRSLLNEHFPELTDRYQKILFEAKAGEEYSTRLMRLVYHLARKQGLEDKVKLCF